MDEACPSGAQQRDVHDKIGTTLGLDTTGNTPDPIEISYRTSSGRRLFL